MKRLNISIKKLFIVNSKASIGVGSLIIFIAMILVSGVVASVIIQTMNNLQQQAMRTGEETLKEISSGLKTTHVSGYSNGSKITNLAIFLTLSAGSNEINLSYVDVSLSDTNKQVILNHDSNLFSSSVSNGVFDTLNTSNLSPSTYGIIVIRDIDNSCTSSTLAINNDDLVIFIVNTTKCFTGIDTRTRVFGKIIPEQGHSGIIDFTTPSAYVNTIIDLQ